MRIARRPLTASVAVAVSLLALLAGCGTRASDAEVRAGAQPGGSVTLDQASVDALAAAATQGGVPADAAGPASLPGITTTGTTGTPGTVATGSGGSKGAATATPQASSAPTAGGKCTAAGAPVTLGQVGTFSGLAGPIAGDGLLAVAAWVKDINARGGLACHPVTLYVRDDGGDPARASAAVRSLVDQRKVAALVANLTALSESGFLPEVKKTCVPAVGLDFGPNWSREPCLFPQGGGWFESISALVKQAVDNGHLKLGLLYCVEIGQCGSAGKLVEEAAERYGAKLVYQSAVSLTQTDFTAQCQNAKNAGVEELAVALEGSAMARLARSCLALNYRPILVGAGLAVSVAQAEDPKLRELTVVAMAPNAPWFLTDQPGQKEYAAAMARYAPQATASGATIQMWAAAKLLEAGVARLGDSARTAPLTPELILKGMNLIRGETLGGLTAPLDFTPANQGLRSSGCVYVALLTAQGWTAPMGSKPLCNLLPKGAS